MLTILVQVPGSYIHLSGEAEKDIYPASVSADQLSFEYGAWFRAVNKEYNSQTSSYLVCLTNAEDELFFLVRTGFTKIG